MERATDRVNIQKEARLSVELRIGTDGSSTHCDGVRSEEVAGESERTSKDTSAMLASQAHDMPMRSKGLPTTPKLQGTI